MVDFIKSNAAIDGFQTGTKFQQNTLANDLALEEGRAGMPSRLRTLAGNANLADANGRVAQATIGENIAQEKTATAQGRSHLRSTDLRNAATEIDMTGEMAKKYYEGSDQEGDNIARRLGKDPDKDPGLQSLKKNRQYAGYVFRLTQESATHSGSPLKRQAYIEHGLKGYQDGQTNDPGRSFRDPTTPRADEAPIYTGRGKGGPIRPFAFEEKRRMLVEKGGYSEKEAVDIASGIKPADPMTIARLVEQQLKTEDPSGLRARDETIARRAELTQTLNEQFRPGPPAAGTPAPAPTAAPPPAAPAAAAPSWWERITGGNGATPPAQAAPSAAAPPVVPAASVAPQAVPLPAQPTPVVAPQAGAAPPPAPVADPTAMPRSQLSTVDLSPTTQAAPVTPPLTPPAPPPAAAPAPPPSMPQLPKLPVASAGEAAQHPAGTWVRLPDGTEAVRVDSAQEALQQYPPGTPVITKDGRPFRVPAAR